MGLFTRIAAGLDLKAQTLDMLPSFLMGPESKSGVPVTWSSALQVTAMLACARVVAEGIAQCGCRLMRKRKARTGADAATDHDLYRLLVAAAERVADGVRVHRDDRLPPDARRQCLCVRQPVEGTGRILELIVIEPSKVRVTRLADLSLVYESAPTKDQPDKAADRARDLAHPRAELERVDGHGDRAPRPRGARVGARARGATRSCTRTG
jgi:hypothetical protein